MGSHKYSNSTGIWSAGSTYGVMIFCHSERRQVRCTGLSSAPRSPHSVVPRWFGKSIHQITPVLCYVQYNNNNRTTHSARTSMYTSNTANNTASIAFIDSYYYISYRSLIRQHLDHTHTQRLVINHNHRSITEKVGIIQYIDPYKDM